GVRDEPGWVDDALGVDLCLQLGRTVVGVDKAFDVLAQAQPELQIGRGQGATSNSAAWPCPTPTHMVAMPRPPPRRRNSCNRLTTSRAPLIPSGCPIAIAPPFTFTLLSSRPSSRTTASDCDAKASFSSTRSSSSTPRPV